jgi:hypothetical protein
MIWLFAAIAPAATGAQAAGIASPVAVLALVPMTVDQYSVAPTAAELAALTGQIRSGVASPAFDLMVLPQSRIPDLACAEIACARRVGRQLGARTVVFGTVVRFIGIRWNAQVSAIEVSTGRVVDKLTYGVLGDHDALRNSVREVGVCLGRSISGEKRCKPNVPAI